MEMKYKTINDYFELFPKKNYGNFNFMGNFQVPLV